MSSLALLQMWEPDEMHAMCSEVHPGVSWTKMTLDACSRGFLTLKNLDVVPLEPIEAVTLCNALFASLTYMYLVCCDDNSLAYFTPQCLM